MHAAAASFGWTIAGLRLRLDLEGNAARGATDLFPAYSTDPPEGPDADVTLRVAVGDRSTDPLDPAEYAPAQRGPLAQYRRSDEPWGHYLMEPGRCVGRFRVDRVDPGLHGVLRLAICAALWRTDRTMLHACSVLRRGRLWVFCGTSGAGKSTIALRLADGGNALSLDRVVMERSADGVVRAHPTPFGDEPVAVGPGGPQPVAGVFFIEQAPSVQLRRLEPVAAVVSLSRFLSRVSLDAELEDAYLEQATAFAGAVPCYHLRFTEDPTFWERVDELEVGVGKERA